MEFAPSSKVVKRIGATHVPGHKLVCSFRNMGPIDQDLLIEVLWRLPPKILMQCCCVCKPWYVLIHRYCVSRITPFPPFLGCDVRIKASSTDLLIGRAVIPVFGEDVDVWPPVFNIHDPAVCGPGNEFSPDATHLLDSQDGLMLFQHPSEMKYVLWNPNTSQFLLIPHPPNPGTFVALSVEIRHWKPNREMDLFKIVSFPKERGTLWKTLDVFYSRNLTWFEHKVNYINNSNRSLVDYTTYRKDYHSIDICPYGLDKRSVYLQGKIFILCYPHNLCWFAIGDSSVDVDFHSVDLPDRVLTKNQRMGCIGSYGGNIRYAQIKALCSVKIWMFNVDTREWTEMYRVALTKLIKHPQLVYLRTVLFPAMRRKLKLLALQPESDDGVIIWTPNIIFCYYLKSGNLVSLRCSNVLNGALDRKLTDIFPFTRCLASLAFEGQGITILD